MCIAIYITSTIYDTGTELMCLTSVAIETSSFQYLYRGIDRIERRGSAGNAAIQPSAPGVNSVHRKTVILKLKDLRSANVSKFC